MMTDIWKITTINEVCDITSSKRIYRADYQAEGVPFYRGKEIIEKQRGVLDVSTELFISEEKFRTIEEKFGAPQPGDLLLTSVGTLGVPYVVQSGERFYFKDGNLTWFRNLRNIDSGFLYYWLLSPSGKAQLGRSTIGSSQSAFTIVLLKQMEIALPPLPTQRKIASILSAYDDLIENNLRRIRILESMAQNLYREWFVKFRFPGHENARFVDSPLGRIPEEWEWLPVEAFIERTIGGGWGKDQMSETHSCPVRVIRGTDFRKLIIGSYEEVPRRYEKPSALRSRKLVGGDLIVENSVNASSRCVGTPLIVTNRLLSMLESDVICASFCKLYHPIRFEYSTLLLLHMRHLLAEGKMNFYQNVATNGIGNFQSQRFLTDEYVPVPCDERVRLKLLNMLTPLLTTVYSERIAVLRRTRDLLLPKGFSTFIRLTI